MPHMLGITALTLKKKKKKKKKRERVFFLVRLKKTFQYSLGPRVFYRGVTSQVYIHLLMILELGLTSKVENNNVLKSKFQIS